MMWNQSWRESGWSSLDSHWDLIVIGGGITGAGILREAARSGLRVLLVEAGDFASGTSSRSSKLVHGGFRYLKNAQMKMTFDSVRERERLLQEGRGLVNPLGFLMVSYQGDPIPGWLFGAGLIVYDLLALKWGHRRYDAFDLRELCPPLAEDGLLGGYRYFDAQTDDARLVLRILQEAQAAGGCALNYTRARSLLRNTAGQVCGVAIEDRAPGSCGRTVEALAPVVVNAAGAWADELRGQIGRRSRLRQLRGSHLVFPASRLPLTRAVSLLHPHDGRPVFAFPWEGVTVVGTTDVDHTGPLQTDPAISPGEAEYLLEAVCKVFPDQALSSADVQVTFSGVRPVVDTGKSDPSKESREHVLWGENGLLTVAGGKLTTFRLMAHQALRAALVRIPGWRGQPVGREGQVLDSIPEDTDGRLAAAVPDPCARLRLLGRYSGNAERLAASAAPGELDAISGAPSLWAELRWAARAEAVIHLDDLLLRRVRLGLLLPEGGAACLERIRMIVQPELGWDDDRWGAEVSAYTKLWKECYDLKT